MVVVEGVCVAVMVTIEGRQPLPLLHKQMHDKRGYHERGGTNKYRQPWHKQIPDKRG